uniref:RNA-directed RNA polymerase n=1 Tax=Leviviridae sp. TaxID=2027243 RepID=A0A514D664_9VIRU|nr:MAG: RNA-dependent RNA polymerase [Leviviridae sp.]
MRTSMRNRVRNLELLARANRSQLEAEKLLAGIAQELWEHLNTPLSLGLSLLARNGQWKDVVSQEFNPGRYLETELETARNDYQAVAFLRKCPLVIAGVDRKKRALDNFVKAEQQCAQTNARFRNMRSGIYDSTVEPVLHLAQRKISSWLGDYISAEFWASSCRFGPGADNLNKGNSVGPYHKLSRISATADFADCAQALVRDHPAWARSVDGRAEGEIPLYVPVDIARGNTVTFVPKTAMIDRSIAIEPQMNIFGQLGLGKLLRTALKRNGLDLDDQGPNQVLAQQGSIDGTVVTIDLSAASDTLAREVVRELVPEKWYFALDLCRSKTGTYRDDEGEISFRYEKFSSMGNGFTFELESMIFYALTLSVCDHLGLPTDQVRAYGDDITAPSGAVELLGKVLTFCGFTVNEQKSYTTSVRFRESCGADFFNGVNIRPYFCKELPTNAICLILWLTVSGVLLLAATVVMVATTGFALLGYTLYIGFLALSGT